MSASDAWDSFYLNLCEVARQKSRDPSTKVGAFIARADHTCVSFGYNGFPRGVIDSVERYMNREEKYPRTVHAEVNAILNSRERLNGCTLYVTPLHPCATCAGIIIQAGIKEIIFKMPEDRPDWLESFKIARSMFAEAGVLVIRR
jgi:dCMP deaminase